VLCWSAKILPALTRAWEVDGLVVRHRSDCREGAGSTEVLAGQEQEWIRPRAFLDSGQLSRWTIGDLMELPVDASERNPTLSGYSIETPASGQR
jgi:hypothetical protein